ncbi:alpha/beta fold hydrolase [Methylococcus sp. EFPC2]|uniref:alpha/beta fold hydrolase n=1 Tax=Methylococcus sp. EFPC2 TaxID=2812648 RepID=UPI0019674A45|nr:alpha/beta hydrolase [Methylococcus sp. EFPC2]QSA97602.1 alpha/beta hydrolase [Methylococcus sp. EFPC2]
MANRVACMAGLLIVCGMFLSGCAVLDQSIPAWQSFAKGTRPATQDIKLYAEKSGKGEPILFIHGFGNDTYTWRHIVPALADNHRTIALDLKGFGYSPKPADHRYSIYEQARLVRDYIVANDLHNVTLIGHSYGGGVALVASIFLAQESPPRQAALVLIDSIAYEQELPSFIKLLATPLLGPLLINLIPAETQVRDVMKEVFYHDEVIPDDAVAAYAHGLFTGNGRCATLTTARQILPKDLPSLAEQYGTIRVPTLIVWGRYDEIVPITNANRLNSAIAGSRLALIDNSGHAPQEEQPALLLPLVKAFLRQVYQQSN